MPAFCRTAKPRSGVLLPLVPQREPLGNHAVSTPLADRPGLFPEDIDTSDPWQFRNILVR